MDKPHTPDRRPLTPWEELSTGKARFQLPLPPTPQEETHKKVEGVLDKGGENK